MVGSFSWPGLFLGLGFGLDLCLIFFLGFGFCVSLGQGLKKYFRFAVAGFCWLALAYIRANDQPLASKKSLSGMLTIGLV